RFQHFTDGLSFRVYLEEKEVTGKPVQSLVGIPSSQFQTVGVPETSTLRIQTSEVRKMVKMAALQMSDDTASWPIRFSSAGTVEILALLTAILGTKDKILLLDEPAQNMHPDFQERFLDVLRQYSE